MGAGAAGMEGPSTHANELGVNSVREVAGVPGK